MNEMDFVGAGICFRSSSSNCSNRSTASLGSKRLVFQGSEETSTSGILETSNTNSRAGRRSALKHDVCFLLSPLNISKLLARIGYPKQARNGLQSSIGQSLKESGAA